MTILWDIRSRAKKVALQVAAAAVVGYFAYHAIEGDRGVKRWAALQEDLRAAKAQQAELIERREGLDARVSLLRRGHLDPDLLEERAQRVLNYGRVDEFVILLPDNEAN